MTIDFKNDTMDFKSYFHLFLFVSLMKRLILKQY